jgi:nucleoside-diphosphate-sugar epimerase
MRTRTIAVSSPRASLVSNLRHLLSNANQLNARCTSILKGTNVPVSKNIHSDLPVVLVTGSSGLIGSRLCAALAPAYTVIGLDVNEFDEPIEGVQWIETDLTSDKSVASALATVAEIAGRRIASVVHLAAYYDFSGASSPLYRELTIEGTRRLLQGFQEFEVEQFVFSSSLLVMEPVEDDEQPLSENSPTQGEWAYPKSKLAAERVIRSHRSNIPAVVLRIAGVYDELGHSIPIGQQIRRIYERDFESHFFPGDPDHGQPFIHLDDVVRCFERVIECRHTLNPYEVFLIAEEELMSYQQLQDRIGQLLYGESWFTLPIPKAIAKAGAWVKDAVSSGEEFIKPWMIELADDHYPVDIAKARDELSWQPNHRLHDTLPAIIENLQADPERWYALHDLGEPPRDIPKGDELENIVVDPFTKVDQAASTANSDQRR